MKDVKLKLILNGNKKHTLYIRHIDMTHYSYNTRPQAIDTIELGRITVTKIWFQHDG